MKKLITIKKAHILESKLMLEANESIKGLIPGEQILVDSQHCSFIYLMEDKEEYTYIVIPEQFWRFIKSAKEQQIPAIITYNEEHIELMNFHEELEYVISNIKGNSNYGEEMVSKVEEFFKI